MDFVPALFPAEAVRVWRHLGCNVAPWNYHERRIVPENGRFVVQARGVASDGPTQVDPLIFLHFSGFDFRRILDGTFNQLNLVDSRSYDDVKPLYDLYGAAISAEADEMSRQLALPYGFGVFADGSPILPSHRRLFRVWRERHGDAAAPFAALEALGNALSQFAHITVVDKLLFYTSGGDSQSSATFDVMGQALLGVAKRSTVLVIFISFMRWGNPDEYAQCLYNIYVLGCGIYFLLIGSPVFQVTSTYYTIVEVALLPMILSKLPQYKVPYMMYLLVVPFFLLVSALSPYMEVYVPYRSIFTTY